MTGREFPPFWVIEDTNGHLKREARASSDRIDLRLYRVQGGRPKLVDSRSYAPGTLTRAGGRAAIALELIDAAALKDEVLICSHRLASASVLAQAFKAAQVQFVMEINSRTNLKFQEAGRPPRYPASDWKLQPATWISIDPQAPESEALYQGADLGRVTLAGVEDLRCFSMRVGGIDSFGRGTWTGITTLGTDRPLAEIAHLLGWARWIRPLVRKGERAVGVSVSMPGNDGESHDAQLVLNLPVRANLQIARKLDEVAAAERSSELFQGAAPRRLLAAEQRPLAVVELFAGAGGMGLGFLLAKGMGPNRFRIIHSGEVNPVFANTLRENHKYLRDNRLIADDSVPETVVAQDLREKSAEDRILGIARENGGVDILIGGPPCQGFSSANRNSWSSANPNNQLIDTFLNYVESLKPKVLLMENVQGILWTAKHSTERTGLSVAHHVIKRLASSGYTFFPKVLDAAWYGVPQHRNRFFLLGVHEELGYSREDFGAWGPFPVPTHGPGTANDFVTVRDAIADLPPVGNGTFDPVCAYEEQAERANPFVRMVRHGAPEGAVTDHVVSRQADYVIERYRGIPEGENWQAIVNMMTNYARVTRTHSNIYRRLKWGEPSITIGHYRKSMIVHPAQDRGLSLREAARLQSFPDWFRFAGKPDSLDGGLTHKQQQLANAVCPLVTREVARFIMTL
jgi:DNA-cytosine methyltransferase